jgi:hypothetical protein
MRHRMCTVQCVVCMLTAALSLYLELLLAPLGSTRIRFMQAVTNGLYPRIPHYAGLCRVVAHHADLLLC